MSEEQDEPYKDAGALKEDDDAERDDDAEQNADGDEEPSPSPQIGRERVGGTHISGHEPGTEPLEGWPMPDQRDTPPEWPNLRFD